MIFCSLDALKNSFKKKEAIKKKEIVELLRYKEIRMMELLALTSDLLATITLTLISSLLLPVVFKKSIFMDLT